MLNYSQSKPKLNILKDFISSYTCSIGRINKTSSKYITRAFPSFFTQVYIEFEGNISMIKSSNENKLILKRTYINTGIGNWSDIFELESTNEIVDVKNFKIDLFPNTLYEVFNISTTELKKDDLRLEDIWTDKQHCRDLLEKLEYSNSAEEMILIFEEYFLQVLKAKITTKNELVHLIKTDDYSLEDLSTKLKLSKRWIQKEHKKFFGLNYKELQSNIRFYKMIIKLNSLLATGSKIDFALIALEFNYYDQAHLIKEFKKYTGFTPNEYVKSKSKNLLLFW